MRLYPRIYDTHFSEYLLIHAKDGVDCYNKIANQYFDFVIMELKLPKKNGKKVIEDVSNKNFANKPGHILLLSDLISSKNIKLNKGEVSYIPKPVEEELFLKFFNDILGHNSTRTTTKKSASYDGASINVDIINPFISATIEVLNTTASTTINKDKVFIKKPEEPSGDISARVELDSELITGDITISFTEASFIEIVNNWLETTYTEINDENKDAASEICNQIAGLAKTKLAEKDYYIEQSLPILTVGREIKAEHATVGPIVSVRFLTANNEPIIIESVITSKKDS